MFHIDLINKQLPNMNVLLQQFANLNLGGQQDIVIHPADGNSDFFIHNDVHPSTSVLKNRLNTYMIRAGAINPKTTINPDPNFATDSLLELRDTYQISKGYHELWQVPFGFNVYAFLTHMSGSNVNFTMTMMVIVDNDVQRLRVAF